MGTATLEEKFEVMKEIGDGSFGSVVLARTRTAGSHVAKRGTMVRGPFPFFFSSHDLIDGSIRALGELEENLSDCLCFIIRTDCDQDDEEDLRILFVMSRVA